MPKKVFEIFRKEKLSKFKEITKKSSEIVTDARAGFETQSASSSGHTSHGGDY